MNHSSLFDRRSVIAGSLATGIAITTAGHAFAQDATPDAATPPEDTLERPDSGGPDLHEEFIDRLNRQMTTLETDLEAVRADIDPSTIDAAVTYAKDLLDQTQSLLDASNNEEAIRFGIATQSAIESASLLIDAQLSYAGLPSDQNWSSRVLASTYAFIDQLTTNIADSASGIDVSFPVETAQSTYSEAYDLYNTGSWAQAGTTGRAATRLGMVATVLTGTGDAVFSVMGPDDRWHRRGDDLLPGFSIIGIGGTGAGARRPVPGSATSCEAGVGNDTGTVEITEPGDDNRDTPVDVPAPDFGN